MPWPAPDGNPSPGKDCTKMLDAKHVWMTRKAYIGLQMQLAALRARRRQDGTAAQEARIQRLDVLMANASVDAVPPDDGVAEPGMVVTIRQELTGETETFLLGLRGAEDVGIEVYSPDSPLGRALAGAHAGERRTYHATDGTPRTVTLLRARPYGTNSSETLRAQLHPPAA